jgi:hypothetical protein
MGGGGLQGELKSSKHSSAMLCILQEGTLSSNLFI